MYVTQIKDSMQLLLVLSELWRQYQQSIKDILSKHVICPYYFISLCLFLSYIMKINQDWEMKTSWASSVDA